MPESTGYPTSDAQQQAHALLDAAIQASLADHADQALALLCDSIGQFHVNPRAHYLLGAEYAQRQRYGDAVMHMTIAIDQAPDMAVARLQLSLLWLTLGNPTSASAQLGPLLELPADQALGRFARALACICNGDVPAAQAELTAGLALGTDNQPLMADMRRLLSALEGGAQPEAVAGQAAAAPAGPAQVSHGMAISVYTGNASDN